MRNTLRALLVTALASAAVMLALPAAAASAASASGAAAASAASGVSTSGVSTSGVSTSGGYDVSHPQCGTLLPTGQAWGVVGVNGGLATTGNPCLADQLAWASGSSGTAAQPAAQVYLNTANPGEIRDQVSTWPDSGMTPYGFCTGANTAACSWQYGWERAQNSVASFFLPAAESATVDSNPGHYVWWLDVETDNTWQSGSSSAQGRNRATLEGMTAYLASRGGTVGIYSVPDQWAQITGSVAWDSNLYRLPSWLPGASSPAEAYRLCAQPPLVRGGEVASAQYVSDGLDHDVSCG